MAVDLDSFDTNKEAKEIIQCLCWTMFSMRPDDGALQLVKEFYANLEEKVVDKVIVRGKWISMFSEAINKLI